MLTRSRAFAECMAKRSFKLVCLDDPTEKVRKKLADLFEKNEAYNLKELIANASVSCIQGEK